MTALILLIPATLAPTLMHMAGKVYFAAAIVLNLAFLYFGVQMSRQHDRPQARRLLLSSVFYVPLLFAFLVIDNPRFTSLFSASTSS
jgi:heme O synthase-like polyprenyltransferase